MPERRLLTTASISIVIPTYNRGFCLGRAITSCQNQTYPPQEIIVVDDGSTDDTPRILSRLATTDPRIRYVRFPENRGAQWARIEGIKASRSEWVAFLDSDDELLPTSLESRLWALAHCDFKPALVYGDAEVQPLRNRPIFLVPFKRLRGNAYPQLLKMIVVSALDALMVRKECLEEVGYPDPTFPSHQEKDLVFTIARRFPILHSGETVVRVHITEDRLTADIARLAEGRRRLTEKYREDILKYHGWFCLLFWNLYYLHLRLSAISQKAFKKYQDMLKNPNVPFWIHKIHLLYRAGLKYSQKAAYKLCLLYFRG